MSTAQTGRSWDPFAWIRSLSSSHLPLNILGFALKLIPLADADGVLRLGDKAPTQTELARLLHLTRRTVNKLLGGLRGVWLDGARLRVPSREDVRRAKRAASEDENDPSHVPTRTPRTSRANRRGAAKPADENDRSHQEPCASPEPACAVESPASCADENDRSHEAPDPDPPLRDDGEGDEKDRSQEGPRASSLPMMMRASPVVLSFENDRSQSNAFAPLLAALAAGRAARDPESDASRAEGESDRSQFMPSGRVEKENDRSLPSDSPNKESASKNKNDDPSVEEEGGAGSGRGSSSSSSLNDGDPGYEALRARLVQELAPQYRPDLAGRPVLARGAWLEPEWMEAQWERVLGASFRHYGPDQAWRGFAPTLQRVLRVTMTPDEWLAVVADVASCKDALRPGLKWVIQSVNAHLKAGRSGVPRSPVPPVGGSSSSGGAVRGSRGGPVPPAPGCVREIVPVEVERRRQGAFLALMGNVLNGEGQAA